MSNPLCITEKLRRAPDLSPDAYLYSSARFKVRAYSMLTPDLLAAIGESGRVEDLLHRLSERGIEIRTDSEGHLQAEEALERYLADSFAEVEKCVPNTRWIALLRYPYDAHNIKTILKCRIREKDPRPLLIGLGTVAPEDAEEAIRTEGYDRFAPEFAKAIPEAIDSFAQTADPQLIDAIIDSACFAAQRNLAASYPPAYFSALINGRIDMTNLLTAVRIGRMKNATAEYCTRHLIEGGKLTKAFFEAHFAEGEDALLIAASREGYPALSKLAGAGFRLSELEKQIEHTVSAAIREAADMPAGLQVIYGYLAEREIEVKNIRILLAAMQAGRTPAEIRALLRA